MHGLEVLGRRFRLGAVRCFARSDAYIWLTKNLLHAPANTTFNLILDQSICGAQQPTLCPLHQAEIPSIHGHGVQHVQHGEPSTESPIATFGHPYIHWAQSSQRMFAHTNHHDLMPITTSEHMRLIVISQLSPLMPIGAIIFYDQQPSIFQFKSHINIEPTALIASFNDLIPPAISDDIVQRGKQFCLNLGGPRICFIGTVAVSAAGCVAALPSVSRSHAAQASPRH